MKELKFTHEYRSDIPLMIEMEKSLNRSDVHKRNRMIKYLEKYGLEKYREFWKNLITMNIVGCFTDTNNERVKVSTCVKAKTLRMDDDKVEVLLNIPDDIDDSRLHLSQFFCVDKCEEDEIAKDKAVFRAELEYWIINKEELDKWKLSCTSVI